LNVLGHDGDTPGVNGAEIGVLKETNQIGFGSLLESKDSTSLKTQVVPEILGNLTDETLEGKLADEEIRRLLVTTDLTKSHSSRAVAVGLLDSCFRGGGLASCLRGALPPVDLRRFASCGPCLLLVDRRDAIVSKKGGEGIIVVRHINRSTRCNIWREIERNRGNS
jgi:hypothetical protein